MLDYLSDGKYRLDRQLWPILRPYQERCFPEHVSPALSEHAEPRDNSRNFMRTSCNASSLFFFSAVVTQHGEPRRCAGNNRTDSTFQGEPLKIREVKDACTVGYCGPVME